MGVWYLVICQLPDDSYVDDGPQRKHIRGMGIFYKYISHENTKIATSGYLCMTVLNSEQFKFVSKATVPEGNLPNTVSMILLYIILLFSNKRMHNI